MQLLQNKLAKGREVFGVTFTGEEAGKLGYMHDTDLCRLYDSLEGADLCNVSVYLPLRSPAVPTIGRVKRDLSVGEFRYSRSPYFEVDCSRFLSEYGFETLSDISSSTDDKIVQCASSLFAKRMLFEMIYARIRHHDLRIQCSYPGSGNDASSTFITVKPLPRESKGIAIKESADITPKLGDAFNIKDMSFQQLGELFKNFAYGLR